MFSPVLWAVADITRGQAERFDSDRHALRRTTRLDPARMASGAIKQICDKRSATRIASACTNPAGSKQPTSSPANHQREYLRTERDIETGGPTVLGGESDAVKQLILSIGSQAC